MGDIEIPKYFKVVWKLTLGKQRIIDIACNYSSDIFQPYIWIFMLSSFLLRHLRNYLTHFLTFWWLLVWLCLEAMCHIQTANGWSTLLLHWSLDLKSSLYFFCIPFFDWEFLLLLCREAEITNGISLILFWFWRKWKAFHWS